MNRSICLSSIALAILAATAQAAVIAEWDFAPGANFLIDSVGGHTLVQGGVGTVTSDTSSGNSAYFGGTGCLKTAATLNLTPYRHLLVSWSMKDQNTAFAVVYDHGWDAAGGLLTDVNEGGLGDGRACIRQTGAGYQNKSLPHAYGTDNSVWADFAVELNLDGATAADQLKVFKNGVNVGTYTANSGLPLGSFMNTTFVLGALTEGGGYFMGNIANMTIESVPEPGTVMLLVTGGLLCCAQRKRK